MVCLFFGSWTIRALPAPQLGAGWTNTQRFERSLTRTLVGTSQCNRYEGSILELTHHWVGRTEHSGGSLERFCSCSLLDCCKPEWSYGVFNCSIQRAFLSFPMRLCEPGGWWIVCVKLIMSCVEVSPQVVLLCNSIVLVREQTHWFSLGRFNVRIFLGPIVIRLAFFWNNLYFFDFNSEMVILHTWERGGRAAMFIYH